MKDVASGHTSALDLQNGWFFAHFQYLYINYVPEQVLAVPRSNTEGGAWQGVTVGVSCVMYCIYTWSYGDKGT